MTKLPHPAIDHVLRSAARVVSVTLLLGCIPAVAQTAAVQDQTTASAAVKGSTPSLSIPVRVPVLPSKPLQQSRVVDPSDPTSMLLQRTGTAHSSEQLSNADMVAEGTVTVVTATGPKAFGVTLLLNGAHGSQRILLLQPDGKNWDGRVEHLAPGGRQALEFLETQHTRGFRKLLDAPSRSAAVIDNGMQDTTQKVTVLETNGDSTQYFLDAVTSRITGFEFVRGPVQSYAFADFRDADGVAMSYRVEHDVDGVKQEELLLTKVQKAAVPLRATVTPTKK